MNNSSIDGGLLLEANDIINGDRLESYGNPKENFKRIADYWNVYFSHKKDSTITPKDATILQILHKICREENKHDKDNLRDIAGYAALANLLAEHEEKANKYIETLKGLNNECK